LIEAAVDHDDINAAAGQPLLPQEWRASELSSRRPVAEQRLIEISRAKIFSLPAPEVDTVVDKRRHQPVIHRIVVRPLDRAGEFIDIAFAA
jgi:hypothetical protein